jgi:hypothetical protein
MRHNLKNSQLAGGSPLAHARITGLVGIAVLASGSFAGFVASKLFVRGDVVATAGNIIASESLFRLGLVGSLVMMIAFIIYGRFGVMRDSFTWSARERASTSKDSSRQKR